jgi:hypothetical protein
MEHIQIAPRPPLVVPEFSVRSRVEPPVRDLFNARRYEMWNTDAPSVSQNFPDINKANPFNDMNPINTRTVTRDYRQSQPFVVEGKGTQNMSRNPYFSKFDVATDPRNVAREMRAAVYEYNPPRDQEVSQRLVRRNFHQRFFGVWDNEEAAYEQAIDVYAGIRPKLNAHKAEFR